MVYDELDDEQSAKRSQTDDSRRKFLAGSAGVLGALTLGGAFGSQSALAQEGDEEGGDPGDAPPEGEFENDLEILNYALTLEYLEAAFYREGLSNLDQDALFDADAEELAHLSAFPEATQTQLYEQLSVVRDHEETHVDALSSLIEDVGGTPVEEPEFDFGTAVEDPVEFVQTAAELEDTGVGAYAGAAPFFGNQGFLVPALSIHSVEGRHAAFVHALAGESPFETAFDQALPEEEVLDTVNEYVDGEAIEPSTGNANAADGNGTNDNVPDDVPVDGNGTAGNATDENTS